MANEGQLWADMPIYNVIPLGVLLLKIHIQVEDLTIVCRKTLQETGFRVVASLQCYERL